MKIHRLEREQWIEAPLERAFAFFSDAANLETLTPGWVGFQFLTPLPIEMRAGAQIEYRLRLAGVPLRWRTLVTSWDAPHGFVDVQESGPYALWEHTHRFSACGEGVLMRDAVRYALPFGPLGAAAHALAVRGALAAIFDHRFLRIREIFATEADAARGRRSA